MTQRMTIYVSSPKSYQDVFNVFLCGIHKYWPNTIYPIFLATNYDVSYDDITVYNSHNSEDNWVNRTIDALSIIQSKYILLMCDDLCIKSSINNDVFEHILDYMDRNDVDYCRLNPNNNERWKEIDNETIIKKVNKETPYAIDLQRGIFKKSFLLQLLGDGSRSAWEIEQILLSSDDGDITKYFNNIIGVTKNILPTIHLVEKGQLRPDSLLELKRHNIPITSGRSIMRWKDVFLNNLRSRFMYIIPNCVRKALNRFR